MGEMGPMRYRKKPVVIDAFRYLGDNCEAVMVWAHGGPFDWNDDTQADGAPIVGDEDCLSILTLEGEMIADPGDWIIKGIKGEFYPCKPDIFEATYEPVPHSALGEQ
jgi:hypothetical protein